MFGFPVNLFDGGLTPVKLTPDGNNGFPKIQQREIFYSVKNGDWADRTIWETASGRVGLLPGINDDVYIRNIVSFNVSNTTTSINSLFVSSRLNFIAGNSPFLIFGSFKVDPNGLVDFSNAGVNSGIYLYSNNNFCNKNCFIPCTLVSSGFAYDGKVEQNILDLNYHNLTIGTIGAFSPTKYLTSNLSIGGNLFVGGILLGNQIVLECGQYDLIVNGTTSTQGKLSKAAQGNLLFVGNCGGKLELTGNPNVEFRGGLIISNVTEACRVTLGIGIMSFTTNNQTINGTGRTSDTTYLYDMANVLIGPGITLTNSATTLSIINYINGTNSLSKLVNNGVTLVFPNQASAENSMSIGIVDFTTFSNTIGYSGNYTATIPSYFTTFHNLSISGTGTKSLGVNTTLNGALTDNGNFECSTYNLIVGGITTIGSGNSFSKNGAGNITFNGNVSPSFYGGASFSLSGNPNVEFKNGLTLIYASIVTGTGQWKISTNNQSLAVSSNTNFDCSILISGAITLTLQSAFLHTILGTINGDNALSKLLLSASSSVNYQSATQPMATGILDTSTNLNTWIYGSGNQDIKGGPTTGAKQVYRNLTLNGGGTKTLQGYVSVLNTYTLTSPATLANNGFTLTNP